MAARIQYPFSPKTTASMRVGQFWTFPLSDGYFGCGYVVSMLPARRKMFVAGLLNWKGGPEPAAGELAGCVVVEHAKAHLKMLEYSGCQVLGCCLDALPVLPDPGDHTWGYDFMRLRAEVRLREGTLTTALGGPVTVLDPLRMLRRPADSN